MELKDDHESKNDESRCRREYQIGGLRVLEPISSLVEDNQQLTKGKGFCNFDHYFQEFHSLDAILLSLHLSKSGFFVLLFGDNKFHHYNRFREEKFIYKC